MNQVSVNFVPHDPIVKSYFWF